MEFFHEFTGNNTGHDDLMGITHHTGDKWLDKKLNENTANIGFLTSMALGAAGSKLLGGSRQPQAYGGGFDPAIRPFMTQGLKDLQAAYESPEYFQGPRVAAFDPAQLQAQTSLLALATAAPDYFRRAEEGLGEAIEMQRQAAAPITAEAIEAQREAFAPIAQAERLAAQRQFRESLRDIGVGAGGAGVGALTGARADIMRGGAAGELAATEAGIQARQTQQALQQLEAQRQAEAAGAASLSALFGEQLGIVKGQTAQDIARAQLAAGVGAERRELAQARIGEQREIFEERDPFARAQRYLATVQSAPTQKRQYYQPRSTLQEAAGLATLISGDGGFSSFFEEGGQIEAGKQDVEEAKKNIRKALATGQIDQQEYDRQMGFLVQKKPTQDKRISKLVKESAASPMQSASLSTPATTTVAPAPPEVSLASLQTEDMDSPPPSVVESREKEQNKESSLMDRIIGGVRSGLQSISSANLDPFKGYTPQERVRIGLGILGAVPEIGEGPLGPIGRGALLAIEDLPEAEVITPRVAPVPSSEYAVIDEGILGLQKTKTKMGAERRNQLRRESEQDVIQAIRNGQVANDPASYRTAVLANYERKVRAEAAAGDAGDTGDSRTIVAPSGKGSTSAGLKALQE